MNTRVISLKTQIHSSGGGALNANADPSKNLLPYFFLVHDLLKSSFQLFNNNNRVVLPMW